MNSRQVNPKTWRGKTLYKHTLSQQLDYSLKLCDISRSMQLAGYGWAPVIKREPNHKLAMPDLKTS